MRILSLAKELFKHKFKIFVSVAIHFCVKVVKKTQITNGRTLEKLDNYHIERKKRLEEANKKLLKKIKAE